MPDLHLDHPSALLSFFILSITGLVFSYLFQKLKLPSILGLLCVGMLLGPVLGVFDPHALHEIETISHITLGIMTFTVGTHLNYKSLHNSWGRILGLAFFDVTLTFGLIFGLLTWLTDLSLILRLLLSSLAISTAPGTVIHVIQHKSARGILVKTLLGVVALNNVAAITIVELCKKIGISMQSGNGGVSTDLLAPVGFVLLGLLIGFTTGCLIAKISRHLHTDAQLLALTILAIVFHQLLADHFSAISALLMNLSCGIAVGNFSYQNKRILKIFESLNVILYTVFFTLAGTHMKLNYLLAAGVGGILFIIGRSLGKISGSFVGGFLTRSPERIRSNLGLALLPQGSLAIGLVISLEIHRAFNQVGPDGLSIATQVSTILFASVAFHEIFGHIAASFAFDRTGETGQESPRLVNFLHEEYIMLPLEATDKWEAIDKMCQFLVKTHHLKKISPAELKEVVIKREKEMSTGLGNGIALPHARIDAKESLMGVIGILKKPLEFESLDGEPVQVLILVATPENQVELHLKVCQTVAKIFTRDSEFIHDLAGCRNAAEAYDLLQSKEVQEINYFMD